MHPRLRGLLYRVWLTGTGRGGRYRAYRELREAEDLSPEEVKRRKLDRLGDLLEHCYENVPYYRDRLDEVGWTPSLSGKRLEETFRTLPVLTKDVIRDEFEALASEDLDDRTWSFNTSGGSTGQPVRFIQDREYRAWREGMKMVYDTWAGWEYGQPKIKLWGSRRDLKPGDQPLKTRIERYLRNETWLSAYQASAEDQREWARVINEKKPRLILAYVESIFELAKFIEREGLEVHSPVSVMTSAGTLDPKMREVISRVFDAPVLNRYGSREVGDIACSCREADGLHVTPLNHYVEILDEDGTPVPRGEVGQVVVTSLTNRAMPLLRYRIGDMAAISETPCQCGRPWPVLEEVTGRRTDVFVAPDGSRVYGGYFRRLLYHEPWVKRFQFVQESRDRIVLRVVPAGTKDEAKRAYEETGESLEAEVEEAMGGTCALDVRFVDRIDRSSSGKHRYTVSKVRE